MEDHYDRLRFELDTQDDKRTFLAGIGALMGHVWAPIMFVWDYSKVVADWLWDICGRTEEERMFYIEDPVTSEKTDLSLTGFVDDLAKQYTALGPFKGKLEARAFAHSQLLQQHMTQAGYKQNLDKLVALLGYRGLGSAATTRKNMVGKGLLGEQGTEKRQVRGCQARCSQQRDGGDQLQDCCHAQSLEVGRLDLASCSTTSAQTSTLHLPCRELCGFRTGGVGVV